MNAVADHEYTIAQAIGEKYLDKEIQIYFGETAGSTHYSDFDIEQKMYLEGKVVGAKGMVLFLECQIITPSSTFKREVIVNCWGIIAVVEKSKSSQITHLFQGNNK